MVYHVIARKWRPQNFDEVVYQNHVSKTIKNSIKSGRISHAYLFTGPRGVGKTTMARIVAKSLNCVDGPTDDPCGKCENCMEIRDGNSFDVIEIDGASNRGIENIRELRENVKFAPLKSRYKVYIIDEVHMLTTPAFNALLKTLEEPPDHIVFIFATTEIHKVPDTILSRCQKYFFKKISVEAIVNHLKHIIKKESFGVNEKALYPIARASDGSMRDAQSLLDQMISFSDGEIEEKDALSILGIVPFESYLNLLKYICNLDAKNVINEIDRVVSLGVDIPRYAAGFVDIIRTIRLIKNDIEIKGVLGLSDEESSLFRDVGENFYDEELSTLFLISNDLLKDLKYSSNERINLEMAFLDMISAKRSPSISSLLKRLENEHDGDKQNAISSGNEVLENSRDNNYSTTSAGGGVDEIDISKDSTGNSSITIDSGNIEEIWIGLLNDMNNENKKFLFEKLKVAKTEFKNGTLYIQYPGDAESADYSGILDGRDIEFIKDEIYRKTGENITITVGRIENSVNEYDLSALGNTPPEEAVMLKNPEIEEVEDINPTVEKVKNIFHGQIINEGDT